MIKNLKCILACEVTPEQLQNMIAYLIMNREPSYILNKKNISSNLQDYVIKFGTDKLTNAHLNEVYKNARGWSEAQKRALVILYREYSSLVEEENTIKFLKSMGD